MQTVNLSANDVLEQLNLWVPEGWTTEANELDVLCVNTPKLELGWIVTLVIKNGVYSFSVHECCFNKETDDDIEHDNEFANYDQMLEHIRYRVAFYALDNF